MGIVVQPLVLYWVPPPPPPLNRFNRKRTVFGLVVAVYYCFIFVYFAFVFVLFFSFVFF